MSIIKHLDYWGNRVRKKTTRLNIANPGSFKLKNKHVLPMVSLIVILIFLLCALGFTQKETQTSKKENFNHIYNSNHNQMKKANSTVTPLGVNFTIKADSGRDVFGGRPGISFDGANFFVVWREPSSNIYGARVSPAGSVLESLGILIASGDGCPSVIFDGTNHVVIWVTGGEIYGARVTPAGTVVDTTPIRITTGGSAKVKPITLAFDGTNYLVAWRTYSDAIYGIRVSTGLSALDDPAGFQIGSGFYPWVAFDGTNYMVVWHKWGNGLDVYASRVSAAGVVLDTGGFPVCAADNHQDHASIACSGENCLVVWHDWRPGNPYNGTARGARVTSDGVLLDDPSIKISDYAYRDCAVVVTFDSSDYLVVWHEDNSAAKNRFFDTFGRRVSTDGTVVDEKGIPIGTGYQHQFGPGVAYGNDTFLVAWNEASCECWETGNVNGQLLQKQSVSEQSSLSVTRGGSYPAKPEGSGWVQVSSPTGYALTDIHGIDINNVYGVTEGINVVNVEIIRYDGSQWTTYEIFTRGHMQAVWATSPSDIWVSGFCWDFWHYDGFDWLSTNCHANGLPMGMWGASSSDILAVGPCIDCLRFDGQDWQDDPTGSMVELRDIWGTSRRNIYTIGEFGTVIHYDGSCWTTLTDVPTKQSLNDLWGSAADDIFFVGDFGTILHYDGSTWLCHDSGTTEHLFGVWGVSPTHVYAVGLNGTILRYNGSNWSSEASGTEVNLLAVWGTGDSLWAMGNQGTILEKTLDCTYPAVPRNLSPADGAVSVPSDMALDWDDSLGTIAYDVYLGTTSPPQKIATVTASTFTYNELALDTHYYWKISAKNACGEIEGVEWDFTTASSPSITLTSPNGGENWTLNTTQNITWNSAGLSNNLAIVLIQNGTKVALIDKNIDPASGSYSWTVGECLRGTITPGTNYKILIGEKVSKVRDSSDAFFTISPPSITVTSPNGGEVWALGTTHDITWTAAGLSNNIHIILRQNGTNVALIVKNMNPATGSYSWTVGDCLRGTVTAGTNYRIVILQKGSTVNDKSDSTFELVN